MPANNAGEAAMVSAEFFTQQSTQAADYPASRSLAEIARWVRVSCATAVLIGLSVFNVMHGPVYDCVRAGAYLLRSRRGPLVPVMQVESLERFTSAIRVAPVSIHPLKESNHVHL
jgi:hypothetical protein